MSTRTLAAVLDQAGVSSLGVLDAQIDVPVLTGMQRQGDLLIVPAPSASPATTPVPAEGVVVVAAESANRNTHSLHGFDGPVCFDRAVGRGQTVGTLTVPDGSSAYLVHTEEHGANAFGPGTYRIVRQREQADEIRMVAD